MPQMRRCWRKNSKKRIFENVNGICATGSAKYTLKNCRKLRLYEGIYWTLYKTDINQRIDLYDLSITKKVRQSVLWRTVAKPLKTAKTSAVPDRERHTDERPKRNGGGNYIWR